MSVRGLLAGLLALALSVASLFAGEPPKGPPPEAPKEKPAPKAAEPPAKATETPAQRTERLGKAYDQAEAMYRDGHFRDSQKLYAQIALEDPGFRRVASRLRDVRKQLEGDDRREREAQVAKLLAAADTHYAAEDFASAAKACEAVLAIERDNGRAQRKLTECAREIELRRRVASIFKDAGAPGGREVIAQAKTTLDEKGPPGEGPPKDAARAVRPAKDFGPAPPKAGRVVKPGENAEAGEAPARAAKAGPPPNKTLDPEGTRLVGEAWDLYQSAKLAKDPRPALRRALDILSPITPASPHAQQTRDTAALLRSSIARRLADEGRQLTPEEARRARLYQRYVEAEDLFRKKRFADTLRVTNEILAEDKGFALARHLNQEARIQQRGLDVLEKDVEQAIVLEKRYDEIADESVPPEAPSSVPRPGIHLKRPAYDVSSPELEEKLNQRVSVNLIAADLDYFLDLLFRSTGVNIIYNPDVVKDKTITVHVANYPLSQLLDYIARNHGLMFAKTRDGVLITTPEEPRLETFVVPIHYGLADVEKPPPTGGDLAKGGSAKPIDPETTSNLEKLVEKFPQLLDWPQGSFTYLDRMMNTLYIRTTRETYQNCLELLDAVDKIPVQVLIKALFVEIAASDFESYGVSASLTAPLVPDPNFQPKYIIDPTNTKYIQDPNVQAPLVPNPNARIPSASFSFPAEGFTKGETAGTITFAGVCGQDQYKLTLTALQRMGRSRILSAPNVICMNNCTAAIAVTTTLIYIEDYEVDRSDISGTSYGSQYPYPTSAPTSGQQVFQQPLSSEPILIPVFSKDEYEGFMFDVTASVGQDTRYVTLTLNPRIRNKVDQVSFDVVLPATTSSTSSSGTTSTTGSTNNKITIVRPILDERSISTKLTVADGSVVVLGGLTSHNKIAVRAKIPILGDIPVLGWLFSKRSYTDERRNLLIFVACEVITPTGARYADSGRVDVSAPPPRPEPRIGIQEEKAPAVRAAP